MTFTRPSLLFLLVLPGVAVWLGMALRYRRLAIRGLIVVLILVAVAGPQWLERAPNRHVVFLVDRSRSVTARSTWEEAVSEMQSVVSASDLDHVNVIGFGGNARVLANSMDHLPTAERGGVDAIRSDLGAVVSLALAHATDPISDLVLLSDGQLRDGLEQGIAAAQHRSIPIHTVALGRTSGSDVRVADMEAPGSVDVGRPFAVDVRVEASVAAGAVLALYRDHELVSRRHVDLKPGMSMHRFQTDLETEGGAMLRAVVKVDADRIPENDSLTVMVRAATAPTVLLVHEGDEIPLRNALDAIGKKYVAVERLPSSLTALLPYREVILADVRLSDLSNEQLRAVQGFVAQVGGGLFVAAGRSIGA